LFFIAFLCEDAQTLAREADFASHNRKP
jgi:hypothetical protein